MQYLYLNWLLVVNMVDFHILEVARSFLSCCCTTSSEGNQVTAGIVAIAKVSL
jgi:hypothetical protein